MNRDFEFRQLMRAYRAGIISEESFEAEMAALEKGANGSGGYRVFGKAYKTESDAVVSFLDKVRVIEASAGVAFANWAKLCTTDCLRSGLRMIAERESYHGRIFEQRLRDLGADMRANVPEDVRTINQCASDAKRSDNQKLLELYDRIKNPEQAIKPIRELADSIKDDLETKEALNLFAEDELSTAKWLKSACELLNAPPEKAVEVPAAEQM